MIARKLYIGLILLFGTACTHSEYKSVKGVVPKGCSALINKDDQQLISMIKSSLLVEEIDFSSSIFREQEMELWILKSNAVDENNLKDIMNTIQSKCDPWISLEFDISEKGLPQVLENKKITSFYQLDFLPNPKISRMDISIDKGSDSILINVK